MATSDSEDYEALDKELFGSDPEDESQDGDPQSNDPLFLCDSPRSQYINSNLSEDMKALIETLNLCKLKPTLLE